MQLKNGLFLGMEGVKFTLHNSKKLIYLDAKNLQSAIKEGEKYNQKK